MVRALKMAVLLLSVHPLPGQCLLHLYPTRMTDLPTLFSPPQLMIVLIKGAGGVCPSAGFRGN